MRKSQGELGAAPSVDENCRSEFAPTQRTQSYDNICAEFRKLRLIAENAPLYLAPLLPPLTVTA
jgi:hypothetical protein